MIFDAHSVRTWICSAEGQQSPSGDAAAAATSALCYAKVTQAQQSPVSVLT